MNRKSVKLNKPIYLGISILDLSKTIMYNFHYNYIKKKFGENVNLLYTDTDSLIYEIITEDVFKEISPDVKAKFDTSNYPKEYPSGIPTGINKKVGEMFKDECGGKIIVEFAATRPKVYGINILDGENIKKCKGINNYVIKMEINFQDYKDCVF